MKLVPITIQDAKIFVARHHRHHRPPTGALFALACSVAEDVNGVVLVGRPLSRMLEDGYTAEVIRLCTDGTRNACSFLYQRAWRATQALGYKRLVTYTLPEEGGASLRASGWKMIGETGGGRWSREDRPRIDAHPLQRKIRWEAT